MSGSCFISGLTMESLDEFAYAKKIEHMDKLTSAGLEEALATTPNFAAHLKAGGLLYILASMMVRIDVLEPSWLLEWSSVGEDIPTLKKSLATCLSVVSSYLALGFGELQAWMAFLQEKLSSA